MFGININLKNTNINRQDCVFLTVFVFNCVINFTEKFIRNVSYIGSDEIDIKHSSKWKFQSLSRIKHWNLLCYLITEN